jgi:hypothetical protein
LSRTIFQDDKIKAVVFGFGQGQELSEHTGGETDDALLKTGQRRQRYQHPCESSAQQTL